MLQPSRADPIDQLPLDAAAVAAWLREPEVDRVRGILEWHGGAAVMLGLESAAQVEVELRAAVFFERVSKAKQARKSLGDWPRTKFRRVATPGDPRPP